MPAHVSVAQIQRLDHLAISVYGMPSLVLMENAGAQLAGEILRTLGGGRRVLIFCGTGNNGGDGFVAARRLVDRGIKPKIWMIGRPRDLKDDARSNYQILRKLKYPVTCAVAGSRVLRAVREADVVVDAIFGVGLNRQIGNTHLFYIDAINRWAKKVIAVDIPSGLDGTTGKIWGVCVKADKTVTFSFPKKGFRLANGPRMTGKVIVADIGIPQQIKKRIIR